jgi:hypothetical protein
LRVVPPSRQLSRSRIAGGELRLGTVSINTDATVPRHVHSYKPLSAHLRPPVPVHGHRWRHHDA